MCSLDDSILFFELEKLTKELVKQEKEDETYHLFIFFDETEYDRYVSVLMNHYKADINETCLLGEKGDGFYWVKDDFYPFEEDGGKYHGSIIAPLSTNKNWVADLVLPDDERAE